MTKRKLKKPIFSLIWSWPVVGIGAPTFYGFGVAAMFGDQYGLAFTFYLIGIIVLAAKILTWKEIQIGQGRTRRGGTVILVICAGLGASYGSWKWIDLRQAHIVAGKLTDADKRIVERQLVEVIARGDTVLAAYTDAVLWKRDADAAAKSIRLLNDWRRETGNLLANGSFRKGTKDYVLTQTGDLITEPLMRLRNVLENLDRWAEKTSRL